MRFPLLRAYPVCFPIDRIFIKITISPNFNSIFLQTGETPYKHGNSYTFTQNSDTITETPDFCLIVRFSPQSPSYQRHPKPKKAGPTTHRDEPHQALKPLILSRSSILSPASTQIPMALFFYCRLCRCESLMTFTPLYPTQFDIRQIALSPLKSILFSAAQSH